MRRISQAVYSAAQRALPGIMPYACGITFVPCSPPEGDTLLAAHSKAFKSLTAAVRNDVEAQWEP